MPRDRTFGALLQRRRIASNLTRADLARKLGYAAETIKKYENGQRRPGVEEAQRIARELGIDPDSEEYQALVGAARSRVGGRQFDPADRAAEEGPAEHGHGARRVTWGEAPDVTEFVGRGTELATLKTWLHDKHCRLIGVFGLGGIGKSLLATRAAVDVAEAFTCVYWRSLRNSPTPDELVNECLSALIGPQAQARGRALEHNLSLLIEAFRSQRALIVLDNFEAVMQSGERAGSFRSGYEGYAELLSMVSQQRHQTCLAITSREQPALLANLAGERRAVRSLTVHGLTPEDGREMLEARHLSADEERWGEFVQRYSGNPLALKMAATFVQEVFDRSIDRFLSSERIQVGDIDDLLEQQLRRLSPLEQELLLWLTIEREAVTWEQIGEQMLERVTPSRLAGAIQALRRRSMIELSDRGYTLQNVVMESLTARLVEQLHTEIITGRPELLHRIPLLKINTREYVRISQRRLLLEALAMRLRDSYDDQQIDARIRELLAQLREQPLGLRSYAGGNLLNLLVTLHGAVEGFDFSRLALWHGTLRGVEAHALDLSGCDLSRSEVTNLFGCIFALALSPTGATLAIGTHDGRIWLLDTASWRVLALYEGHTNLVWSLDFSPDGRLLASGSYDQQVMLWDAHGGGLVRSIQEHREYVRTVQFSSDSRELLSASEDKTVRLWDVADGSCTLTISGAVWWSAAALSPDGQQIACASYDRTIYLWDRVSGTWGEALAGHRDVVWHLAYSADGNTLVSASNDKTARIWDVRTHSCRHILAGHTSGISRLCFTPDQTRLLTVADDHTLRLWNAATGQCLRHYAGHRDWVTAASFAPDGQTLYSAGRDQSIRHWDVATGDTLYLLQGYQNGFSQIAFHPDGTLLASASLDGTVRLWDVALGTCLRSLPAHKQGAHALAFSADGTLLASGGADTLIKIWDTATWLLTHTLRGHQEDLGGLAFSPDGKLLLSSATDASALLWELPQGRLLRSLEQPGMPSERNKVAFSPDGSLACVVNERCEAQIYATPSGRPFGPPLQQAGTIRTVSFSPDGGLIATGATDNTIAIWELPAAQQIWTFAEHNEWVISVGFSPDGRLLASGGADGVIIVRDLALRSVTHHLEGHAGWIESVVFSPDGRWLASGGQDEQIRIWNVETGTCVAAWPLVRPYSGCTIIDFQKKNMEGGEQRGEMPRGTLAFAKT